MSQVQHTAKTQVCRTSEGIRFYSSERIDAGDQIKRMHQPGGDGSLCNADDAEKSTMPMDGRRMSQPPVLNIEVSNSHSSSKSALKGTAGGVDHAVGPLLFRANIRA